MKTSKLQSVLALLICFASFNVMASNHLTVSLQNCSQPSSNTIQFDLYAVNDGAAGDLTANAFQIGLNFNTAILQNGAKITASYVNGSNDFKDAGNTNSFNFPASGFADHIRIVQSVNNNGNTVKGMVPGQQYKIGTFILSSTQAFVDGVSPEFEFQTSTVTGKTVCAALTWVGSAVTTTSAVIPGSGTAAEQRANARTNNNLPVALSTTISCKMAKTSSASLQSISVYPNPTTSNVTVSFNSEVAGDYHIVLVDAAGRLVMENNGKAVQGANLVDVDTRSVAKGVYMMTLQQGDNKMQQRLVVE